MFCTRCGAQVENNAAFCQVCGNALAQSAYQQPVSQPEYQQQVYQQYNYKENYLEKFGINMVYPNGRNDIGDLYVTATEIIFVKKSKAVRFAFGLIGSTIESGEEKVRINIADVVVGGKTSIGINTNVYQLTLRNGEVYKLCVNNPAKLLYLRQIFGY